MNKQRSFPVDVKDALDIECLKKEGIQYAWIQSLSTVVLENIDQLDAIDPDELIEARFFSHEKEIHVFQYDDEFKAVRIEKLADDIGLISDDNLASVLKQDKGDYYEEKQKLRIRFGETLTLRHYLSTDDDGLARVSATVLCDCDLGGRQ